MDNKNNKDKKDKFDFKKIKPILIVIVVALIVTAFVNACINRFSNGTETEISYDEFVKMLDDKEVESVTEKDSEYLVVPIDQDNPLSKTTYTVIPVSSDYEIAQRVIDSGATYSHEAEDGSAVLVNIILTWILPFVLIYGFFYLMMRNVGGKGGGGIMGVGKSNAKLYVEKSTGVTFADVAGQEESKESLIEMVDFLNNPGKYTEIGAKLPKGALLVGPPGTGKTLMAKALAGEAGVPFFSLSGSDFVEMFVGVGASRVRDLFKQAQEMAPCIIFIDEIDAIGKSRDTRFGGGNDEREQTLNALLAEMDGFDSSGGIIILAATNRPEVLDKALLRPGRFDRRVVVERPDLKGRIEVLKVHSKNVRMDETVDLKEIALATSGAVGSDLANMVNEAALNAVKHGRKAVSQKDLFEAVEVVIAGKEKKDRIMSEQEKRVVAYHEVGHALVMALQKEAEPVQKITIVPRTMGALGYTMQTPEEEKYLNTKEEMLADLVSFYGGRAAEQVKFNSITTGASNDIERATALARAMVTQYGMSEKFGVVGLERVTGQYLDGRRVLECSEVTEAEVDEEVRKIVNEAYEKAVTLILQNMDILDRVAEFLLEKETITGKEFMQIFKEVEADRVLAAQAEANQEMPCIEAEEESADMTADAAESNLDLSEE